MGMDLSTVAGFAIAFVTLVATVFLEGGSLLSLLKPSAAVLILGGTVGATVIGFRGPDLRRVPAAIISAFRERRENPSAVIDTLVNMAERARREGLLALQDDVRLIDNSLLARGLQLAVDGTDPDVVRTTMETQVEFTERSQLNAAAALEAAGGYAPTVGIIGTVMGLVQVLQNLGNAEELGHAIALAFLATLYGIATANLFWLPLASKIKQNIYHESLIAHMYIAGVTGLQTGETPRALRERLEVYLAETSRREPASPRESRA